MKVRDVEYILGEAKLYANTLSLTSGALLQLKDDRPVLMVEVKAKAMLL